jgi:hypothetical protein
MEDVDYFCDKLEIVIKELAKEDVAIVDIEKQE